MRKIIHVDMDAFYASVEQRDNPALRGVPVIVGGKPAGRGVVAACSYEARRFGIHSAMPSARAYRLCPEAVFIAPRFPVYRAVSQQIRAIFAGYTELVEPLSLDEAYLDVSDAPFHGGSATRIAQAITGRIASELSLTASAGVSYNKFLAKMASEVNKPDGLYVITPAAGADFVARLPVARFFGIGPATAKKLNANGIETGADLRALNRAELRGLLGKAGDYYYNVARGIDNRPVVAHRIRKSLGSETTFGDDVTDLPRAVQELTALSDKVAAMLLRAKLVPRTITVKVKYDNFRQITRSASMAAAPVSGAAIMSVVTPLLERTDIGRRPVRLLGITTSNFLSAEEREQLALFE